MQDLLSKLSGGDRRSIGRSEEVARLVLDRPALFEQLFNGLFDADPLVRMRAADAAEKVTRQRPELLDPYRGRLLEIAAQTVEKELRWHIVQMLPRARLTRVERREALRIVFRYLEDKSSIVKTFAMQALVDLAAGVKRKGRHSGGRFARVDEERKGCHSGGRFARAGEDQLIGDVMPLIENLAQTGTPAMRARGRLLLKQLHRANRP